MRFRRKQMMSIENSSCDIDELAIRPARMVAKKYERMLLVDRMTFHQDSLGAFGDCPPPQRFLQVAVLGEPVERNVDRVSPIVLITVSDLGEDAAPRSLPHELHRRRVDVYHHRTCCLTNDPLDQEECFRAAMAEPDDDEVRARRRNDCAGFGDLDVAGDHLMPESGDHRRHELEPILSLVGNDDT